MTPRQLAVLGWSLVAGAALLLIGTIGWVRWSNVVADRRAQEERTTLLRTWSSAPTQSTLPTLGEGFALLSIPRLRDSVWKVPIFHGVDDEQLQAGVGHYPESAFPGKPGNFAVAGHRTAHGEPFNAFEDLRSGDIVIVETSTKQYVYTLVRDTVVQPTDTWVVSTDAAQQVNKSDDAAIITLVTCTPKWSTSQRWVWWGVLRNPAVLAYR
jgi:sortase A